MHWLRRICYCLIAIIVIGVGWFWTPDTSFDALFEKYANANSEFITLEDGTRIHFRDSGNPNGPVLLMIHGTSDSLLTWDMLNPKLESRYRLLSLDLPGHGFSSAPETPSFEHFVDAATALLDHLEIDSAIWIGNSLGGGIAWRAALLEPTRVQGLILLDPSGAPRTQPAPSHIGFKILANPVGRFLGRHITPRFLIARSLEGSVANSATVTLERVNRYWDLLRLPGNRKALANLAGLRRSDNSWASIGQINQPTLIVWGKEDRITPTENAKLFQAAMQHASLVIYDNVGHLPMIENPQRLAKDIDEFVTNLSTEIYP